MASISLRNKLKDVGTSKMAVTPKVQPGSFTNVSSVDSNGANIVTPESAKLHGFAKFIYEVSGSSELERMLAYEDDVCRERMLGDLVNTGVVATLLTGFSYDTWVTVNQPPNTFLEVVKDAVTFAAIQTSMLSAISSTFLYKKVSSCNGKQAKRFLSLHRNFLLAPHISFCIAAILFLIMVLLFGYMSTGKFVLRLVYVGMSLGCPATIGLFFLSASRIKLDEENENENAH